MIQEAHLRAEVRKLGRQFLHAEELGFNHPTTGERMKFKAPLPSELSSLLEELESKRGPFELRTSNCGFARFEL
jgi:23S rRNA pseudouridine1911/1915/1917 synthase